LSEPVRVYQVRGEIGAHRLQAAPTRAAGDKAKRPNSLAVMPFRAQGGDEEQRFLAEGLTEELIVELGRFRRLSVASRSASFAIADSARDTVKVGEALCVRYVLDGQVRKIGGALRIALSLAETDSGTVVWSDKFVRPTEEFWDALDQTAAKIAATVVGRVEEAGMVALRRRPPENYEAFECLLRGVEHHRLGGVTDDNAREAVMWFSRAIEADPHYAAAYAYRVCAASGTTDFDFNQGMRDVRKALELDPCDPESNRILGFMEFVCGHDEAAKSLMARAAQLNPSDAYIMARNAAIMTFLGDPERALALVDEAEHLDPLLPVNCVEERGVALYALGRYGAALDALTRLVFQTYRSRLYRAASLVALGRAAEARKLCDEAVAGNPRLTVAMFLQHERFRDAGLRERLGERVAEAGLPA
jgi:adenylate cyclase